ncbi:MAG: hypothetical protein IPJ30_05320 [Acidobacteria bacterium]|nr:hypothetical protein [Acidobacteriota bacterium]
MTDTRDASSTSTTTAKRFQYQSPRRGKTNNGADSDFTRTYATFSHTTKEINTNFNGLSVIGPGNGFSLKVLDKVTFLTETNGVWAEHRLQLQLIRTGLEDHEQGGRRASA